MMDNGSLRNELASRLRAGLSRYRVQGVSGISEHAPGLFSYCALERERLACVRLDRPLIGIVLSGAKEVWLGDVSERFAAGTAFVLPAAVDLEIVNEPDGRTHLYQSLILPVEPDMLPQVGPGDAARAPAQDTFVVPLTPGRVQALLHAADAIDAGPAEAVLRTARLHELLALLHDAPAARPLFDVTIAERVARLVRSEPDRRWTAADIATRLALSESTLRRRLAGEGQALSVILRRERMAVARRLIAQGAASGTAGLAVGYASRAHFARAFRATFGVNPAQLEPAP